MSDIGEGAARAHAGSPNSDFLNPFRGGSRAREEGPNQEGWIYKVRVGENRVGPEYLIILMNQGFMTVAHYPGFCYHPPEKSGAGTLIEMVKTIWQLLHGFFSARTVLIAENLALRQQLAVYKRTAKRPKLRKRNRIFWVWLSKIWGGWKSSLIIVQPETVICWHREKLNCTGAGNPGKDGPAGQRSIWNYES